MESIMLILPALAAGPALVAQGTLSAAGEDAYNKLKKLIQDKIAGHPEAEIVLAEYVEEPDVSQKQTRLQRKLIAVAADEDEEIMQAAQKLMGLVNPQQAAKGKFNTQITGNVQGFVQGDNAKVEMTFGNNS